MVQKELNEFFGQPNMYGTSWVLEMSEEYYVVYMIV